jgi:hypothetical protein
LVETIATEMSARKRTVQRAIRKAIDDDLLIVFGPKGSRRCNTYRLRLVNILERARAEVEGANMSPQRCQSDTPAVPNSHPRGANMSPRSSIEVPLETRAETGVVVDDSLRGVWGGKAPHPADGWGVAEQELIAYGVQDPRTAIQEARDRGCSVPFVRLVIDYARSQTTADGIRAWNGGALCRRVINLAPGQAIDDEKLWMPPSPEFVVAREREADRRRLADERGEREECTAARRMEAESREALESEFGTALDTLTRPELDDLADEAIPGGRGGFAFRHYLKAGANSPARSMLLKQLAARNETGVE